MPGAPLCPALFLPTYERMQDRFTSSDDINVTIARTAPAVLELLSDGVARNKKAIVAALAGFHAKDDVVRTIMRLAVTGQIADVDRRYSLWPTTGPDQGVGA